MSVISNLKASGGLLCEIAAAPGHPGAAICFAWLLVREMRASAPNGGALLWVRQASAAAETGDAYGPGLRNLGISPDSLIVVDARTEVTALRAALEGARCAALSAVVLETSNAIDLTASRRLKLASEKSGVAVVLVRLAMKTVPNAAQVRWRVEAASQTKPASSNARSFAAFKVEIVKHPAGLAGKSCIMEWNHDRHRFAEALPVSVDTVSDIGPLAA